jgi:hypothetical protein
MTTTFLIQSETQPLTVEFPAIAPMSQEEFYAFCLANRELRIERTAQGEVIIMPPPFPIQAIATLIWQYIWECGQNEMGQGWGLTLVRDLLCRMAPRDRQMRLGSKQNAGTP